MLHSRTKLVYNFLFLAPGRARRGNMNIHRTIRTLLVIGMATGLAPLFAGADDAALGLCAVRGVTLNAAGQPVAMVSVAIHSTDGSTDRKMVSDGDGVFVADRSEEHTSELQSP